MTEQNEQGKPRHNWNLLAKEALDIWQSHLTALAADEKAKKDMAKLITPMTQMYAQWAELMQSTLQDAPASSSSAPAQAQPQPQEKPPEPKASTPDAPYQQPEVQESPVQTFSEAVMTTAAHMTQENMTHDLQPEDSASQPDSIQPDSIQPDSIQPEPSVSPDQPVFVTAPSAEAPQQPQPVATTAPETIVPPRVEASTSRDAVIADSSRDLANIADRLAQLERELDSMRPSTKRSTESWKDASGGN